MKVLMFGWEFPPYSSGGLGTACYGLTKSLSKQGVSIAFVLPYDSEVHDDFINLVSANIRIRKVTSILKPYMSSKQYSDVKGRQKRSGRIYGESLFEEVYRYSEAAKKIATEEDFDVIHCHDWMTFRAGINAKRIKHKPLVVHVHSTEFDRTGGLSVNQYV